MSRYIDADALIAKWEEDIKHITNASFRAMMQGAINEVSNAPIADVVEVIHAHWIKNWEIGWSACSHCGKGYLWEDYKGVADWNYCPNCGAKLDEERREDAEIH